MADLKTDNLDIMDYDNASSKIKALVSPISDEYIPSISDKIWSGFFSKDCASQTENSELLNLKEVTRMVQLLVQDLSALKKNLYLARYVLEADYKNKLEEKSIDLYCRVNERVVDLERMHEERVKTIRRCFKQQLADVIAQISNQHERFINEEIAKRKKLEKYKKNDDLLKKQRGKAAEQQEALLMMMKMQLMEQQERADRDLEDALNQQYMAQQNESSSAERKQLVSQIDELETKLEDMGSALKQYEEEKKQMTREVRSLSDKLNQEQAITDRLKQEVIDAKAECEREKNESTKQLERQKLYLQQNYENRLRKVQEDMAATSQKQMDELMMKQMSKYRARELENRRELEEALKKKERDVIPDSEKDSAIRKLQNIEKKLNKEIASLRKELARVNKTWEMKVAILKQSMNALKDEAFLRMTLQRQAARLHQASLTYASDGPFIIPRDPVPLNKRFKIIPPSSFEGDKNCATSQDRLVCSDGDSKHEGNGQLRFCISEGKTYKKTQENALCHKDHIYGPCISSQSKLSDIIRWIYLRNNT